MLNHLLPWRIVGGPWIGYTIGLLVALAPQWIATLQAQNLDSVKLLPTGGQRGSNVSIELPGKFEKWPISFWSEPNSIQWSATDTPGKIAANIPADAKLGLHWVRLYSNESVSPLLRFLVSEFSSVIEAEPNDAFAKPQPIESIPADIYGTLQKSGDVDHYQLKLSNGQRLVASLDANRTLKSPMDACLEIVDIKGNVLAFPESPDSTIGYAGGDKYLYRLECLVGDVDDLATGFQADAQAIIEPSELQMPTLVTLAENQSRYAFFGALESPKDQDVLQLETKAPGFWKVSAFAESLGSPVDAVIEVFDAQDKSQGKQGESGEIKDPVMPSQMKTPGLYRIAIRDLHGRFGPSFRYRLELQNESPLVLGTVANDIIQGKPDKPTEIEVTLERTHGCAEEATISLKGLSPDYTCESVVSKMKEETEKKIVLKVVATPKADGGLPAAWAGPIAIEVQTQGRSEGKPANSANTKEPYLWLRIAP
jgi:hypothetical protein